MIRVVMTNDEIKEACCDWLQRHGAPQDHLVLHIKSATPLLIEATVNVEAPAFTGPYR